MPKPHRKSAVKKLGTPQSTFSGRVKGKKKVDKKKVPSRLSRNRRVRRGFERCRPLSKIETFLSDYAVLPHMEILVTAAWTLASWLAVLWDRFPHLAVTSPEKRCGKSRLLELLELITHEACNTMNISPAAIYRLIEKEMPTLITDEAQSLKRRGSENAEVVRELFNAGIARNSVVVRCVGKDHDVKKFPIYSPKVIALIGNLDSVLADRCLGISMKRKTRDDVVKKFRLRFAEPIGEELKQTIEEWVEKHSERIKNIYDTLEPFDIENDRMAELLLPLQAVLMIEDKDRLPELEEYAKSLDGADQIVETAGVRLLMACREIFHASKKSFIPTAMLVTKLLNRLEEPWLRWNHGNPITAETLANLLRPYGIRSSRNRSQTARGFHAYDFEESWSRYLPPTPSKTPSKPTNLSKPT